MRLLVIADHEETGLWDYYSASKTEGVDLILSAGDLRPEYLEFLTTMVNEPLVYVRGNHDGIYDEKEPEGCVNADGFICLYKGLRILGLGGSCRYGNRKDMYTESEMEKRVRGLRPVLKITGGFDILLTHAPSKGYGDLEDLPHRGFACFNELLKEYRPQYMIHGHVHREYGGFQRERIHSSGTKIINAYGAYMIEVDEDLFQPVKASGIRRFIMRKKIISI